MLSIESGTPFDKKPGEEAGEEPGMGTFGQPADLTEQARPATEAAGVEPNRSYDKKANPQGEAEPLSRIHRGMARGRDVINPLGYESVRTQPWRRPSGKS